MGPFKHTVDDGLDLRKAAFECMYTLLDSCLDRIDIFEFLNHVEDGLKDHYDIKMLTYLMLVRLSALCPSQLLQSRIRSLIMRFVFNWHIYSFNVFSVSKYSSKVWTFLFCIIGMDRLVEPLKNACLQKIRNNAVKQEYEKNDELKRSALRAVVALLNIQDADRNPIITEFMANIKMSPELSEIFENIQKDAKDALSLKDGASSVAHMDVN
jgi:cullin-associated NEDD8-dissociated protein 1